MTNHMQAAVEAQPEFVHNETTYTVVQTTHGKRLDLCGYDYYDELWDQDVKDLIHFLNTHFGAPCD